MIATVELPVALMGQMNDLADGFTEHLLSVLMQAGLPAATRWSILIACMGEVPHLHVILSSH